MRYFVLKLTSGETVAYHLKNTTFFGKELSDDELVQNLIELDFLKLEEGTYINMAQVESFKLNKS